jgi:hypothetical protein
MAKKRKSTELRARDVAIPIGLLILLVLVIVGIIDIGIQQGWNIPGIGSIGLSGGQTGTGGTGTYTSTYTYCGLNEICTYTSTNSLGSVTTGTGTIVTGTTIITTTGQSFIPVGQVAFNMQLVADFTDGSSQTISSIGSLPGLDVFQVGGKNVQDVTARTLVGFVSANPLPSTAVADIKANVTLFNERTSLAVWRTYEYTTGFVDGSTTALVLLPDFTVTPQTVYSDACNTLTNGTITCNTVGGVAPASRRVDWSVVATVAISGLSVIPQTFTGSTVSSADFSTAIQGCVNCGGGGTPSTPTSPTIPAAVTPTGATTTKGDTVVVKCTGSNCGGGSGPTPTPVTPVSSLTGCVMQILPLPMFATICNVPPTPVSTTQTQTQKVTGTDKQTADTKGGATGGGSAKEAGAGAVKTGGSVNGQRLESLLPDYYVPLSLGNGTWTFLNPWAALFFAVIYIAFTFGVLMLVVLWRRVGKRNHR